jgi:hypothetical protein
MFFYYYNIFENECKHFQRRNNERIESIQINFFFFVNLVTRAVVWHPFTSIIVNHLNPKRNRNSHSLSATFSYENFEEFFFLLSFAYIHNILSAHLSLINNYMNCTVREKEKKVEVLIVKSFMHLPIEKSM